MTPIELKNRTKRFAIEVIKLCEELPKTMAGRAIGNQIIRSSTSVAANYRAACRARSKAEFASRIGVVEEEADETGFWLELIGETSLMSTSRLRPLLQEADELTRIMVASSRRVRPRQEREFVV
jgi:four helix bundle protein